MNQRSFSCLKYGVMVVVSLYIELMRPYYIIINSIKLGISNKYFNNIILFTMANIP